MTTLSVEVAGNGDAAGAFAGVLSSDRRRAMTQRGELLSAGLARTHELTKRPESRFNRERRANFRHQE